MGGGYLKRYSHVLKMAINQGGYLKGGGVFKLEMQRTSDISDIRYPMNIYRSGSDSGYRLFSNSRSGSDSGDEKF